MKAVISCPDPHFPTLTGNGRVRCSDNSVDPLLEPFITGLGDLEWSDVSLLIGALLLSCVIATGYNILSKMFWRG